MVELMTSLGKYPIIDGSLMTKPKPKSLEGRKDIQAVHPIKCKQETQALFHNQGPDIRANKSMQAEEYS